jgi:hypothetical protein
MKPIVDTLPVPVPARQESLGALKGLAEVGAVTGAIASLGGVVGLVLATFAKTVYPSAKISYGDWIGYSGALAGLFALVAEVAHRAS